MAKINHKTVENRLLAALPKEEYERLLPQLEPVYLANRKILYNAGDFVRYAYFPNDGMVSLLSMTQDGSTTEVAMVGNEGMVGLPIILRSHKTPYQMMVQITVESALRVRAVELRNEFNRGGKLHDLLLQYTHVVLTQITQSASCNRFHTVEERLARWLLIARDRVNSNTVRFTQETISHTLGAQRTGITMAAVTLQKRNLIAYSRGRINILDPEGLQSMACECYQVIKEEFDNFLREEDYDPSLDA
jgi:CRP-like cAMP-binding protein